MFRFPWGDFHSLNLGWFLQKFNELREDWATAKAGIDGALDAEIQKAEDALTDVFAARDAAAASASAANSSALNASQSSLASMDARDQSRAARVAAQQAAGNAAASETAAGNSATAASNSAGAAATSATQAGNSATAAGNSATAAGQSATNAAASETAAGNSAAAAAASETAAGNSATDAEEAATSIEASAEQIATNAADIAILKEAVTDNVVNDIDFEYIVGRRLANNAAIGTQIDVSASQANAGYVYLVAPIKKGDVIIVSGNGLSAYQPAVFTDLDYRVVRRAANYTSPRNFNYIAAVDGYIVSCCKKDTEYKATKLNNVAAYFAKIVANVLLSPYANKTYSINELFIMNNKFYKAIAAINESTEITVGTNATETTIAELLSLLNI